MASWMDEFTEREKDVINDLARREYHDMTPEEVQLYARWTAAKTQADADYQHAQEQRDAITAEKLALARQQTAIAIAAIEEIRDHAIAYYESTIPVIEGD